MIRKKVVGEQPRSTHIKYRQKVQTAEGWKRSMMKVRQAKAAKKSGK